MTDYSPRITRATARRMMRLLNMEYKPSEIAEELSLSPKTIYETYISAGLPHRRDASGNIWIVGTELVKWANVVLQKSGRDVKKPAGKNQAYCMSCEKISDYRKIIKRVPMSKNRIMVHSTCSLCGGRMVKITKGEK